MANPSVAGNSYRAARRSTRRDEAVLVTVSGVDARRGPYSEKVSTLTISCHGCKYPSKYQVLPDALVTLELHPESNGSAKISTRGRVKWIQRDPDTGGPLYTAVEFENPQNIWPIPAPPEDWLQFAEERKRGPEPVQTRPVAVLRPEIAVAARKPERASIITASEAPRTQPLPAGNRALAPLMGEFQQQMELMISEAAATAVREKTTSLVTEIRAGLREDAKTILVQVAAQQAGDWATQCLKQIQQASQDSAQTLHSKWTKKIAADFGESLQRIETRQREVEVLSETLFANSLERLQRTLETFHQEAVERLVVRLKDRMAPAFKDAKEVAGSLTKQKEDIEKSLADSSEKTAAKIEETCARLEKQFEIVMRARLDSAQEELERVAGGVATSTMQNITAASGRHEKEAQARLHQESERAVESAKKSLEQKAAATSNEFAAEMTHYSRSHLEFVSGAIGELAKGIGKRSKE
jgi:phage terminase small subunit